MERSASISGILPPPRGQILPQRPLSRLASRVSLSQTTEQQQKVPLPRAVPPKQQKKTEDDTVPNVARLSNCLRERPLSRTSQGGGVSNEAASRPASQLKAREVVPIVVEKGRDTTLSAAAPPGVPSGRRYRQETLFSRPSSSFKREQPTEDKAYRDFCLAFVQSPFAEKICELDPQSIVTVRKMIESDTKETQ